MATHSITYTTLKHLPGRLALEVRAACKEAYEFNDDTIEAMPERPDDLEFTRLRKVGHWAVCEMIQNLERQFENL